MEDDGCDVFFELLITLRWSEKALEVFAFYAFEFFTELCHGWWNLGGGEMVESFEDELGEVVALS